MSFFLWWYAASALVVFFITFFGVGKTSYHNYGDSGWKAIGFGLATGLVLGAFWPMTLLFARADALAIKGHAARIGDRLANLFFGKKP